MATLLVDEKGLTITPLVEGKPIWTGLPELTIEEQAALSDLSLEVLAICISTGRPAINSAQLYGPAPEMVSGIDKMYGYVSTGTFVLAQREYSDSAAAAVRVARFLKDK